ncbi:MAG: hypothetical protein IKD28_05990 [Clostridia bacterium]|nr:hypothetical protein [Clostridia bacterium]
MNNLTVGFAKVNINPPMGHAIYGYYVPRFVKGFLDDVEVSAMVLGCGEECVALVSVDVCGVATSLVGEWSAAIETATGIPADNVIISATHTHTGGLLIPNEMFAADDDMTHRYGTFVGERVTDAVRLALADSKPARMGYIVGYAPARVAYIRRYQMKDGSTMTCPPINDPNIDHPIGTLDQRVNLLRFDREGASTVLLVNYGLHADTVGGELVSADWPGVMRRTLEKTLDGVQTMFMNGAEGDVGSTNVYVKEGDGDMNDTEISFDNEMKSPGMARFVGRALAGTVLQVYDKVQYVDVDRLGVIRRSLAVPANRPTAEEAVLAHQYKDLHDAGRDDLIPYTAMELTTVVAEALRMCRLENAPENFYLPLSALRIGNVALLGIPGEPFTEVGVGIKEAEGFDMIMPCSLTNGDDGYFPVQSAYDEGGYETRTSPYRAGVAEAIVTAAREMLAEL